MLHGAYGRWSVAVLTVAVNFICNFDLSYDFISNKVLSLLR